MDHNILKNLSQSLIEQAKLMIQTTTPVQTTNVQPLNENLVGNQHKIDANKNGKIDGEDFKLLRRKKAVKEAIERGVAVEDIVQFNAPMQSDLHEEIGVVVHRDRRDNTIHVVSEGKKYKLTKGQVTEVSEGLLGEGDSIQVYKIKSRDNEKSLPKMVIRKPNARPKPLELDDEEKQMKEEAEQIDEISDAMKIDYLKKASGASEHPNLLKRALGKKYPNSVPDLADKAKGLFGKKIGAAISGDKFSNEDQKSLGRTVNKKFNREKIATNTAQKMGIFTKEEVEQIDEVSKETMMSYKKGAEAQIAASKKPGKPSKAAVALRVKRGAGLEKVKSKLEAIYKKESEARMAERKNANAAIDSHFEKNHDAIFKKHGFKLASQGETDEHNIKTYIHPHENGHATIVSVQTKKGDEGIGGYKHEVRGVNTKGTSYGSHYPNQGVFGAKDVERQKNEMLPKFEAHVIRMKEEGASNNR